MAQKQGKSHKQARSSRQRHKYDRQWQRTANNKLRRINYQRNLAGLPLLKAMIFKDKKGTPIYAHV